MPDRNTTADRKVAITGLGIVAPGSTGADAFWSNCKEGKVFTGPITVFDTSGIRCPVAAEIRETPDFQGLADGIRTSYTDGSLSRTQLLALMSAEMALTDAGLKGENTPCAVHEKIHIAAGSTMGIEDSLLRNEPAEDLADPPDAMLNRFAPFHITEAIQKYFHFTDSSSRMFMNACAAGNYAIGNAFEEILSGRCDVALAGGVDALSYLAITGFNRLLSVTPDVCRPFDKNRKGMVVGEGSAFLFLEEYDHAVNRGVPIYAVMTGYGLGVDAHHITSPSPDGRGAAQAMNRALQRASLIGDAIDYVSAHGTGTAANDAAESIALAGVFGEKMPPMSSIKSMIGHTMGAASAIEAAACCLMLKHQELLPTANFETPDERCPVDCVPNKSRKAALTHVMSNALAFGGNNSSVIFSAVNTVSKATGTDFPAINKKENTLNGCASEQASCSAKARILFSHTFTCEDLPAYYAENLASIDTRMVDRQSLLFTAAIADAAKTHGIDLASLPPEHTAIVSGSNHSALLPSIGFLNTAIEKGALGVSPMTFPNTVGNAPASRTSIWLGLRDKVICLSDGPMLSGLDALITGLEEVNRDSECAFACLLDKDTAVVAFIGKNRLIP